MEITEEAITNLVGEESFQKGLDYYLTGSVIKYNELDGVIRAKVVGTKKYTVEVNTWDLSVSCDCPAIYYQKYCKHVVAVLLTKAKGFVSTTTPKTNLFTKTKSKKFTVPDKTIDRVKSPEEITKEIKIKWRQMSHRYGYQTYWEGQESFADYLHNRQFEYPSTHTGFEDMMDLAFWLGDHFDADDSNGVLQDAIYELVAESVKNMEVDYQGLPIKYLSKVCEIEVADYLISAMFSELSNQKIIDDLIIYIKRGLNESNNSLYLYALAQYYIDKKLEIKMDILFDQYPDDLAKMYLDNLFASKKSAKIVKKLWKYRDKFNIDAEKIIWALKKEREYQKLLDFYCGIFMKESVSSASIQKLQEYCKLAKEEDTFGVLLAKKKTLVKNTYGLEDILMYERNYDEAANKRISKFKENTYISKVDYDEIETFSLKVLILDKEVGIKLFDFLVQDQMEKVQRSNHYDRLERYLSKLINLGQFEKVKKYTSEAIKKYPAKKVLISILKKIKTSAQTTL